MNNRQHHAAVRAEEFSEEDRTPQNPPQFVGSCTSTEVPNLDDAYEYVRAQEESGFGDPLVGNNDDFDILQYIGASDTPEGSPAAFGVASNPAAIYQQQQLLNATASELVQALQNGPLPLQAHHQLQKATALDNAGLVMYNGMEQQAGVVVARTAHGRNGGRQTRLPESPPITDVSGAGSSVSPGSSGCDSASPFSPEQYHYMQQQMGGADVASAGGVLLMPQHPREDMLLVNQIQMMGQRGMLMRAGGASECLHSPNSEFLSPYPPSQSTPGSQHSSQVSPPAISHKNSISYLLQSQPPQPAHSAAGTFVSMDNLFVASTDGLNGNSEAEMGGGQQQQFHHQQPHGQKRRRMSSSAAPGSNESLPLNGNGNLPNVKSEIGATNHNMRDQQRMLIHSQQQSFEDLDENMNSQRTIKFDGCMRETWNTLYDANQQPLHTMPIAVVADKGFNYSASDNCFVNQKKNHFQITVNIASNPTAASNPTNAATTSTLSMNSAPMNFRPDPFTPRYVRYKGTLQPILDQEFILAFCGVKSEMPTSEIRIKQSQTDRKPIDHDPVKFTIDGSTGSVKQTVPRLHFSETTMNNHRKNGKPNPEQKYFLLAVRLMAKTPLGPVLVQAFHSDRVIVRASNPGQFEQPDQELNWQRGHNGAIAFPGPVCIGTEKPIGDAQLTVHGNLATTGNITRPSDRRVKEDIAELSTAEAMNRVAQIRLVEYAYKPEIAQQWGLSEQDRHRVGVIAQELAEVLPEAVKDNGEFLTVDDTRVFYDTVAAAQELYRLTGNLECKIDQVEKISQKLARYAQRRKQLGSMASGLSDLSAFLGPPKAEKQSSSGMSFSRTSLTTVGTTNDDGMEERRRRSNKDDGNNNNRSLRHHRCRSYSSASAYCNRSPFHGGPDTALCSSKFTQGTIVFLVVIMALCLVTMCTLYVMDWYNRTYVFPAHFERHFPAGIDVNKLPMPQPDPDGVGEMIKLLKPSWKPPVDQTAPALTVVCGPTALASLVAGPFVPSCPQYCCAPKSELYDQLGAKISRGVDSLVALATKAGASLLPPAPQQMATEQHFEAQQPKAFANGVKIEVINLNATLDARFCVGESCDARNGRFILYIPLSPNLPTIPLQLRISTEDPALIVDGCGRLSKFNHRACDLDGDLQSNDDQAKILPSSTRVMENIFELSAGSFRQSAYTFRIGHSADLCRQDEKQRGRIFDEFNLIFYRTCSGDQEEEEEREGGATPSRRMANATV